VLPHLLIGEVLDIIPKRLGQWGKERLKRNALTNPKLYRNLYENGRKRLKCSKIKSFLILTI